MSIPLCIDLDGTLIKTDSFVESLIKLVKRNPFHLIQCLGWFLKGRAYLKQRVNALVNIDPKTMPYTADFLSFLKREHAEGRQLVLVTGADYSTAERISNYLGIFSDVLASDGKRNLTGKNKRDVLNERFGKGKYDYAGNSSVDMHVWSDCRSAIAVNTNSKLITKLKKIADVAQVFPPQKATLKTFLKAIRIHQYAKNTLVFVPLLVSHLYFHIPSLLSSLYAFIAFCFTASSVYLLNDLLDLEADRGHRTKRHRPFASGDLNIIAALVMIPAFLIVAFMIASELPRYFQLVIVIYYIATLSYSFYFKQKMLLDVFLLAILYTLRIFAGMEAINSGYSEWLISFSLFFFLSLAFVKRYSELLFAKQENKKEIAGRSYLTSDLPQLSLFGAISGYVSILVFALYLNSSKVMTMYHYPKLLWLVCLFMLYWITRIWMLATRGKVDEDPVYFAIKDRVSFFVLVGIIAVVLMATL